MMHANTTALILVDPQVDFLNPEGKLFGAVEAVSKENHLVNRLNQLLDVAHDKGFTVIFTPITFQPGYPEAGTEPYGIFAPVVQSGAFISGRSGAGISNLLHRAESDLVVEKNHINAFEDTNLEATLKNRGIDTIVLAGLLTDICVASTMRSAYDKGLTVYTIKDATATLDAEKQRAAIDFQFPFFSKPITTREFVDIHSKAVA